MAYIEDPDLPAHPASLESIFDVQNIKQVGEIFSA